MGKGSSEKAARTGGKLECIEEAGKGYEKKEGEGERHSKRLLGNIFAGLNAYSFPMVFMSVQNSR
jgi:hypothetical protein